MSEKIEVTKEPTSSEWIDVNERTPPTKPHSYMTEMSEKVLVKGSRKNQYPWVAHLHVDKSVNYKTYAWGFDKNNIRYTWLEPYRDISDNQKITHWMPLPKLPEDDI